MKSFKFRLKDVSRGGRAVSLYEGVCVFVRMGWLVTVNDGLIIWEVWGVGYSP